MTIIKSRVAVLDGLRALAIILVLMRHGIRPFWLDMSTPFFAVGKVEFANVFANGWIGVDLFFVLSGYLITSHLLGRYFDPAKRSMDIKTYAKRRFLRIAPAYYAALTLAVLGLFPWYPYPETLDNIGWRYVYHLLFLQDYLPSDINVVFWSLAVEIKFYLMAPFILMVLLKMKNSIHRILALGAVFLLLQLSRLYLTADFPPGNNYVFYFEHVRSIFHLTLDGLVIGMLCAVIWKDDKLSVWLSRPMIADRVFFGGFALIFALALFNAPLDLGVSFFDVVALPGLLALGFGAMLLGLMGGSRASGFFAWRGWFPVALTSYSVYLLHLPMLYPAQVLTYAFLDPVTTDPHLLMLLFVPFFIALSFGAAALSYKFIEKPFLAKK
jgi:peptidoglycan/LPS O-acetylase OafA/YrhL